MALTPQDPHKAVITSVGSAIGGGTASSSKPVITGTADAGAIVDIFDGVRMIGTAIVASNGTWSFTPTADLKAGSHSFTAISVASNGDMGASSTPMSVTVPSGTPVGPVKPVIDGGGPTDDTGHPLPNPTNDPRPEMSGSGTPGDIITMYDGNTPIGSTVIDGTGQWHVKPDKDLGPGSHDIYVIETNPAGVPSQPSDHYPVVIDTTVPKAPIVTGLTDDHGIAIPNGSTTADGHPTMNGTGAPGDIVKMYDGQNVIGSAKVDANGNWSITPTKDLSNAIHDLYAIETNAAGTSGQTSGHFVITVDTTVPQTPATPTMTDDNGATIPAGSTTSDAHPHINGTGNAGDIIKVYDGSILIGSTTVGADNKWSFTPSTDLSAGAHSINVTETNAAGTSSVHSDAINVSIIAYIPPGPIALAAPGTVFLMDDNGNAIPTGNWTGDRLPHISGTGMPGDTITVYDNIAGVGTITVGTAIVDGKGQWSLTPSTGLPIGLNTIYFKESNAQGTSQASEVAYFNIDSTGKQPNISLWSSTGTQDISEMSNNGSTASTATHFYFSGLVPGRQYTLIETRSNAPSVTFTASAAGLADLTTPNAKGPGGWGFWAYYLAETGSGNKVTPVVSFVVGTVMPPIPTLISLTDDSGAAYHAGSAINNKQPTINGTGKAGDIITVYDGASNPIGSTIVNSNGQWTYKILTPLSEGQHKISAQDNGTIGTAIASNVVTVLVNSKIPDAPTLLTLKNDSGLAIAAGSTSGDPHPYINGAGKAGDLITVYDGSKVIGSTIVDYTGNWTFKPSSDMASGAHDISAVETNAAGTSSVQSAHVNFVVGYVAPTVPSTPPMPTLTDDHGNNLSGIWTGDSRPHISGTGTPGDTITVYDQTTQGQVTLGTTIIDAHGNWTFTPSSDLTGSNTKHTIFVDESNAVGRSQNSKTVAFNVDFVGQPMVAGVWASSAGHDIAEVSNNGSTSATDLHFYFSGLVSGRQYTLSDSRGLLSKTFYATTLGLGDTIVSCPAGYFGFSLADTANGQVLTPFVYLKTGVSLLSSTYQPAVTAVVDDSSHASSVSASDEALQQGDHHTVVGEHDTFKGTSGHDIVDLNADPDSYFKETTGHIEGSTAHPVDASGVQAVNTLHLTGDHQVLDLTSLTGKTSAAKISGIEVVDLGGQHNTLKLSLIDVLNLGETDLFQKDGKQQMMVQGKDGDSVDLSNTHIAGLADGEWAAHGTAVVGGVTYNVYEHSGAHTELLVQQGVQIVVH